MSEAREAENKGADGQFRRPSYTGELPGLLCIGNVTIDESVQPDGMRREALGGDAIFAVLAARQAGGRADWLAPLGVDFPELLLDRLRDARLGDGGLPPRDLPSVRNVITYDVDGGRVWDLVTGRDHFDQMSVYPEDMPPQALATPGMLVLAMSVPSQLALVPWLRANTEATIYLDLEEDGVLGNEAALREMIGSAHVFLPSEIEATRLTGASSIEDAARECAALGPDTIVIKRAERGALVLTGDVVTDVPTDPVDPVDPTGAGDAFCGAFAAAHLRGGDPVEAARIGAIAARVALSGYGVEALLNGAIERERSRA